VKIIFKSGEATTEMGVFMMNSGTMGFDEMDAMQIGVPVWIKTNIVTGRDGNPFHKVHFVDVNKGVNYEALMANIAKETNKMVGATAHQLLSTVLMSEDVQNAFETAGDDGVELTEEHIMNALELPAAVLMLNNRPLYLFDADSDTAKTIVATADYRRTSANTNTAAATTTTTNARTSANTNNH